MKSILIFYLLLCSCAVIAQQDPLYSQYINNPFVINPAYAGFTNNLSTAVSYRQQWAGFEGGPKTFNASGHVSLFDNRMGAGLMISSDQIGSNTVTEVFGSYAYRIQIDNKRTLSFGLQAGVANYVVDNSKVNPADPGDPLFEGSVSELKPSFGAGIIYSTDLLFVGLSVPRMLESKVTADDVTSTLYTQHYYIVGSYLFFLTNRVRFKPSALVRLVSGAPASVDLNASVILYENYQAGLLTRNFNTYGIFLQGVFKNSFRLGYVFEVPTGNSVGVNYTTHEITLGFRMNLFSFHDNSSAISF
jgi:type IX secretion system PorP/SprF family membrane protein